MPANPCGSYSSIGTQVLREDPVGVWTAIGGIAEMPSYNATQEVQECGGYNAGVTGYRQKYKTGLIDQDDMTLTMDFISQDAVQMGLRTDFEATTSRNFRIVLPDDTNTTMELACNVTSWGLPIPAAGEVLQRSVTLQPTGDPTYTE